MIRLEILNAFIMGSWRITTYLFERSDYTLTFNRENGEGRFDCQILARDPSKLSILLEFKQYCPKRKEEDEALLQSSLN